MQFIKLFIYVTEIILSLVLTYNRLLLSYLIIFSSIRATSLNYRIDFEIGELCYYFSFKIDINEFNRINCSK